MKKAVLLVAALVMICSFAFAAEPVAELKIAEFTGNAKVTFGIDLGTGSAAFANAAEADIKLDLLSAGDKSTTGDNIWGELKIKADGDPVGLKVKQDATKDGFDSSKITDAKDFNGNYFYPYGFKIFVDTAILHIGSMAYIGIKSGHTNIDYVMLPDECAAVFLVDPDQHYGQLDKTLIGANFITILSDDVENVGVWDTPATGEDATQGITVGVSLPNLVNVDVDLRSINKWDGGGTGLTAELAGDDMNMFGARAAVDVKAVPNLTAVVAAGTGFGGVNKFYDIAFGGKVSYKIALSDTMYVLPKASIDAVYDVATTYAENATKDLGFVAQAGVLLGWGVKSKFNQYFSADKDYDWGYYPGVSAGAVVISKKVLAPFLLNDYMVGLNVSAFSGTLIENLTANAALEIMNILPKKDATLLELAVDPSVVADNSMVMAANMNLKYDIKMDPMIISPKFGLYFMSFTPPDAMASLITDEEKTDVYVKAGVDFAKIFPNTTLSFEYASNDFVGGVGNIPSASQTMAEKPLGKFETILKISF